MEEDKIKKIKSLRVTTGFDCDCHCRYCTQINSGISKRLDGDGSQLQSLYAILNNRQILDDSLSVEIEGGEPLLHPDLIKKIVLLCDQMEEYGISIEYIIVTNCHKLNTEEGRELILWMKDRGCNFVIAASFDHAQKNPRYLTDDTYEFLKSCGARSVFCVYVIENKLLLDRAKKNIDFINNKGFPISIYWNFLKYDELADSDTAEKYKKLICDTNNDACMQRFCGSPSECGWIGISPAGKLYGCHEANFGIADLDAGRKMDKEKCSTCEMNDVCIQCIVRKAIYGDSLCSYVKANYDLWKEGAKNRWVNKQNRNKR